MKGMSGILAIVGIVAIIVVGGYFFLGYRGEVIKDKVLNQLDALIGKEELAKKEMDGEIAKIKQSIRELDKGKIESEVRAEQVEKKIKEIDSQLGKYKESLTIVKEYIEKAQTSKAPVKIGDKEYTETQLNEMAKKQVDAFKDLDTKKMTLESTRKIYQDAATSLADKKDKAEKLLTGLQNQIQVVEARIEESKTLKNAAKLMGDNDATLQDKFTSLQKKLDERETAAKVALKTAEQDYNAVAKKADPLPDADNIIKSVQGSEKTLSEIDAILGKK